MNRTKSFIYNSISAASFQIVTMAVGFIIPRIMLQSYGSEINGLVLSISQFISYFNLAEAGLGAAAIYALYKPIADKDYKAINGIVSATKRFYTLSGYIFLTLTLGLAVIYPFFIKVDSLNSYNVALLVLVLGGAGALEFFTMSKYRVLLTADQKNYILSLVSIISIILNAIIIMFLGSLKVNIVILRLVAIAPIFLRSFILFVYVKIRYRYVNYKEKPDNKSLDKRWDALYLQILGSIQIGMPIVLATFFTNLRLVSIYAIYNMVIGGINGMLSIFINGVSASFGEIIARNEIEKLQKTIKEFEFVYYSIVTITYSIAMITIMPFIRIYTKGIADINYDIPIIGSLFVLNGMLYNIKTPQGMLVISAGMYKETRKQSTIQAIIIVVAGIILTPMFGLTGILIASILSNIYRDIELMFYIPKNLTKLPVRITAMRILRIFISSAIICVPFLFIDTVPQNYFNWFGSVVGIATYSILVTCIMCFIFDRKEANNVFARVKIILGGKK